MSGVATRVVVVGGYEDVGFAHLVTGLPAECGFAVIAVGSPDVPHLMERLRRATELPILLAEHERVLEPNRVYVVAQGDVLLEHGRFSIKPTTVPGVQLDRLVRSNVDEAGRHSTLVLLDGLGTDGVLGAKRVKEVGGLVLAGPVPEGPIGVMPRSAIAIGLVDQVGSHGEIVARLCEPERQPAEEDQREGQADALRDILSLVRIRSGHDFSAYKRATLYRRVARRMQVCQCESILDYHLYLREHPAELSHLMRDFLISVTNFFRDPEAYDALSTQVLAPMLHQRTEPVRAWVAGCATGEEAYSLGMVLLEHAARQPHPPKVQLFATDIDEAALAEARAGRYPETIGVDVSPERLERFFVHEAGTYRVSHELREIVLFSPHNLLRDPPFSRLDLVSCRNLLIYLNREAQNRVLSTFHFSLRPEGILLLGSSESAENTTMFSAIDPKHRIFTRRMTPIALGLETVTTSSRWQPPAIPLTTSVERSGSSRGALHHQLAERYAPPSILIDAKLDVVHVSEHAKQFLEVAPGEPTRHVLRMVLPGLRLELRAAIYAARQAETRFDIRRVVFEEQRKQRSVELRVRAVENPELGEALLVFFGELDANGDSPPASNGDSVMEPVVREIEDELQRTRDQLRMTIEQYETSVEELKASNEELQAINEELRSASEELETSREELQSINEELTTLNHELRFKIDEVSHANGDLQNLMTSTDIGVVFLDRSLNIKRFTTRALDLFNLIPSDVGRPLAHLTHKLDIDELPELAQLVLQQLRVIERDVTSHDGRRYLVRLLPYRSLEDRIEGVVMTFVDVTDLREAIEARRRIEVALQASEARLRVSLLGAPLVVFSLDPRLHVTWGYAVGEPLPLGPLQIVAPSHRDRLEALVAEVFAVGASRRTELALEIRGKVRTYEVRFEPTPANEVTAVGIDVTSKTH